MSIIDTFTSVASSLNPISLVNDAVEGVCDEYFPEWVGDIATGALSYYTGDYAGLVESGIDLLDNLKSPAESSAAAEKSRAESSAATKSQSSEAGAKAAKPGVSEGEGSSSSKGTASARDFLAKHPTPESFTDAIMNGELPDNLSEAGMMMVQQRLHQIQQMNALMTQMMKSIHEMQMEIIRNIRT